MKHQKAVQIIEKLTIAVQKFKSNARESVESASDGAEPHIVDAVLAGMYPWLFDEKKNVLNALLILSERSQKGEKISPQEFYNIMYIFDSFLPTVKMSLDVAWNLKLPDPDIRWVSGWEE